MQPQPLTNCSALQRDVLLTLDKLVAVSGAAVIEELQGVRDVSQAAVYDALQQLERMELVEQEPNGRERQYRVTDHGRDGVDAHRRWVAG